MAENVKEDNIDSLCKKYFTPEQCEDCVTESKSTLERKLRVQLEKYGKKISQEYHYVTEEDTEDELIQTISECFKKWKEDVPSKSYRAYYLTALQNNFKNMNKRAEKRKTVSLDEPASSDEYDDSTLMDKLQGDERLSVDYRVDSISEIQDAKLKFLFIDKCYRAKKRSDFLKSMITQRLYEDLHKYFTMIDEGSIDEAFVKDSKERYVFIDDTVYNWESAPTAKDVAAYLKKDEGQMSKAVNRFLDFVLEMYENEGMNL